MEKTLTEQQVRDIASANSIEYATLKAIIDVEASGHGFAMDTGKILIQFEPSWYKRIDVKDGFSGGGIWEQNKVENQAGEWKAFNDAFSKDKNAAMQATSWGMMQVMGFHSQLLGFASVGDMVDFAKESEANQVELGLRFIKSNPKLYAAVKKKDWPTVAYYYNGEQYKKFNYDARLQSAYSKYAV